MYFFGKLRAYVTYRFTDGRTRGCCARSLLLDGIAALFTRRRSSPESVLERDRGTQADAASSSPLPSLSTAQERTTSVNCVHMSQTASQTAGLDAALAR